MSCLCWCHSLSCHCKSVLDHCLWSHTLCWYWVTDLGQFFTWSKSVNEVWSGSTLNVEGQVYYTVLNLNLKALILKYVALKPEAFILLAIYMLYSIPVILTLRDNSTWILELLTCAKNNVYIFYPTSFCPKRS